MAITEANRKTHKAVRRRIVGVSRSGGRAGSGLHAAVPGGKVLALRSGRFNVSIEDLKAIALPALRHRIILNFEGEAEGIDGDRLIQEVLESAEAATREGKEVFLR